jgi:hypothetical protein
VDAPTLSKSKLRWLVMQDRQQMALLYRSFRSLLNLVKEIYFEVSI